MLAASELVEATTPTVCLTCHRSFFFAKTYAQQYTFPVITSQLQYVEVRIRGEAKALLTSELCRISGVRTRDQKVKPKMAKTARAIRRQS